MPSLVAAITAGSAATSIQSAPASVYARARLRIAGKCPKLAPQMSLNHVPRSNEFKGDEYNTDQKVDLCGKR